MCHCRSCATCCSTGCPADPGAADTEAHAAALDDQSALLRHEAAYCLGQQNQAEAVPILQQLLDDLAEASMCAGSSAECLRRPSSQPERNTRAG